MIQPHKQTAWLIAWPHGLRGAVTAMFATSLLFGSVDVFSAEPSEADRLKAAFIFHFSHFVEWPADHPEGITIGVLGQDPFNGALETIDGKLVNGRPIRIKQLQSTNQAIDEVQVLVVGFSEEDAFSRVLGRVADQPILTVADSDAMNVEGVIIAFFRKGTRQKFIVDQTAASQAGLRLRSQLLQAAALAK